MEDTLPPLPVTPLAAEQTSREKPGAHPGRAAPAEDVLDITLISHGTPAAAKPLALSELRSLTALLGRSQVCGSIPRCRTPHISLHTAALHVLNTQTCLLLSFSRQVFLQFLYSSITFHHPLSKPVWPRGRRENVGGNISKAL